MTNTLPLSGIKILDFSRMIAGPYATRILADLGADVIKVEPPEGDGSRAFGKHRSGLSSMFTQQNVGKRSICVDLRKEGSAELMLALVEQADVVVENFRPGIMARYGLGWEQLSSVKPSLVMLSISGFGQEGPQRDRAAYAPVVHAETGLVHRQNHFARSDQPAGIALSIADTVTGLHGTIALLTALRHAERTGIGQQIDMAMINAMFFTDDYANASLDGNDAPDGGGLILEATGGAVLIAGDEKYVWHVLSKKAGLEDPSPADADTKTKIAQRRQAIEAFFRSFSNREDFAATLDDLNLAWGDVLDHRSVFEQQGSVEARGIVATVTERDGSQRKVMNNPYRFSNTDTFISGPAPHCGQHNNDAIRDWLGDSTPNLEDLHSRGILVRESRE